MYIKNKKRGIFYKGNNNQSNENPLDLFKNIISKKILVVLTLILLFGIAVTCFMLGGDSEITGYSIANIQEGASCVDLSDESSVNNNPYITNISSSWYEFTVNGTITLCTDQYTFSVSGATEAVIEFLGANYSFDCNGATITNSHVDLNGYGMYMQGNQDNITIENCEFNEFSNGLRIFSSLLYYRENLTIKNNTFDGNDYGMHLKYAKNDTFVNNTIVNSGTYGMYFDQTSINSFYYGNNISNNGDAADEYGIYFSNINNRDNIFYNNYFSNTYNVANPGGASNAWNTSYRDGTNFLGGDKIGGNYWNDLNCVDHGTGVYPYNNSGDYICDDFGYVIIDTDDNSRSGLDYFPMSTKTSGCVDMPDNFPISVVGIGTMCREDMTITNSGSSRGVIETFIDTYFDCNGSNFYGDDGSTDFGIHMMEGNYNDTIKNCNLNDFGNGINIVGGTGPGFNASKNSFINCTINSSSGVGIFVGGNARRNLILNNTILNSASHGIHISANTADYNNISRNNISNNGDAADEYGIYADTGDFNHIWDNYLSNTYNAKADTDNQHWNISKTLGTSIIGEDYIGGNYWSDYLYGDEDGDGIGEESYNVTFDYDYFPLTLNFTGNNAPTVGNVMLNSTSTANYTNGTLQGYFEYSDADNDVQSMNETQWWKDGVLQEALINFTSINSENTSSGEIWNFSARVHDGTVWSDWSSNESLTIVNAPPILNSINLINTNENNYSSGDLNVSYDATDIDGESLTPLVYWYVDGSISTSLINSTNVESGNLSSSENWVVNLSLFDGNGSSKNLSASLEIIAVPSVESPAPEYTGGNTIVEDVEEEENETIEELVIEESCDMEFELGRIYEAEEMSVSVYDYEITGVVDLFFITNELLTNVNLTVECAESDSNRVYKKFGLDAIGLSNDDLDYLSVAYAVEKDWIDDWIDQYFVVVNDNGEEYEAFFYDEDDDYYYYEFYPESLGTMSFEVALDSQREVCDLEFWYEEIFEAEEINLPVYDYDITGVIDVLFQTNNYLSEVSFTVECGDVGTERVYKTFGLNAEEFTIEDLNYLSVGLVVEKYWIDSWEEAYFVLKNEDGEEYEAIIFDEDEEFYYFEIYPETLGTMSFEAVSGEYIGEEETGIIQYISDLQESSVIAEIFDESLNVINVEAISSFGLLKFLMIFAISLILLLMTIFLIFRNKRNEYYERNISEEDKRNRIELNNEYI